MKLSLFALTALLASATAAPAPIAGKDARGLLPFANDILPIVNEIPVVNDVLPVLTGIQPVGDIMAILTGVPPPPPAAAPAEAPVSDPAAPSALNGTGTSPTALNVTDASGFVGTVKYLLYDVKKHTATINATLLSAQIDTKLVEVEIAAIVDLIKVASLSLGAVGKTLKFTDAQLSAIVRAVVALVAEVVATIAQLLVHIDLKILLEVVLGQLSVVLAGLVLLIEQLVGGVLEVVLELLGLPVFVDVLRLLLVGLLDALTTGYIHIL